MISLKDFSPTFFKVLGVPLALELGLFDHLQSSPEKGSLGLEACLLTLLCGIAAYISTANSLDPFNFQFFISESSRHVTGKRSNGNTPVLIINQGYIIVGIRQHCRQLEIIQSFTKMVNCC